MQGAKFHERGLGQLNEARTCHTLPTCVLFHKINKTNISNSACFSFIIQLQYRDPISNSLLNLTAIHDALEGILPKSLLLLKGKTETNFYVT